MDLGIPSGPLLSLKPFDVRGGLDCGAMQPGLIVGIQSQITVQSQYLLAK